jgi:hypothetical protein
MQNAFPLTLTVATAGWAVHESSGSIIDAALGSNP